VSTPVRWARTGDEMMLTIPGFQPMNQTAPHIESAVESKTYVKNAQIRRKSSQSQAPPSGNFSVRSRSMGSTNCAWILGGIQYQFAASHGKARPISGRNRLPWICGTRQRRRPLTVRYARAPYPSTQITSGPQDAPRNYAE
jgi:hypothetical protein